MGAEGGSERRRPAGIHVRYGFAGKNKKKKERQKEREYWTSSLGCDSGAAGQDVQRHTFAEEDLAHGSSDDGAGGGRFNDMALFDLPLDADA